MWIGRIDTCTQGHHAVNHHQEPRKILIELFTHCARVVAMNTLLKSSTSMSKQRRYGVFVSSHHLMGSQPEQAQLALASLFPEQNSHHIFALFQQGKSFLVREGKQDSLDTFAARLYSQGFQVEVLPLD